MATPAIPMATRRFRSKTVIRTGGGCLVVGAGWLAKNPQGRSHVARLSLSLSPQPRRRATNAPSLSSCHKLACTAAARRGPPRPPAVSRELGGAVCGSAAATLRFWCGDSARAQATATGGIEMSASPRVQFAWAIVVRGAVGIALAVLAFGVPAMTAALLGYTGRRLCAHRRCRGGRCRHARPWHRSAFLAVRCRRKLGRATRTRRVPHATNSAATARPARCSWGITAGVFRITAAVHVRRPRREWLLALSGAVEVALGLVVLQYQDAGPDGVAGAFGAYAGVGGVMLAACGIRLRRGPAPVPA